MKKDSRPTINIDRKDDIIIRRIQSEANVKFDHALFVDQEEVDPVMKLLDIYLYPEKYPESKNIKRDPSKYQKYANLYNLLAMQGKKPIVKSRVVDPTVVKEKEEYIAFRIKQEQENGNLSVPDNKKIQEKVEGGTKAIKVKL